MDSLKGEFFGFFYVRYLTQLHLPLVRFHCVGGCWDRTLDYCNFGIEARRSDHAGRSHSLLRLGIILQSAGSHPPLGRLDLIHYTARPHLQTRLDLIHIG
jgi:hypothetical protein